jgi:hypothetical protein
MLSGSRHVVVAAVSDHRLAILDLLHFPTADWRFWICCTLRPPTGDSGFAALSDRRPFQREYIHQLTDHGAASRHPASPQPAGACKMCFRPAICFILSRPPTDRRCEGVSGDPRGGRRDGGTATPGRAPFGAVRRDGSPLFRAATGRGTRR